MSDTPETDAASERNIYGVACKVDVDFARKLERERDKAREEAKRLEELCVSVHDRLLRGDNDCDLLDMLEEAWKKAARHKEAAK